MDNKKKKFNQKSRKNKKIKNSKKNIKTQSILEERNKLKISKKVMNNIYGNNRVISEEEKRFSMGDLIIGVVDDQGNNKGTKNIENLLKTLTAEAEYISLNSIGLVKEELSVQPTLLAIAIDVLHELAELILPIKTVPGIDDDNIHIYIYTHIYIYNKDNNNAYIHTYINIYIYIYIYRIKTIPGIDDDNIHIYVYIHIYIYTLRIIIMHIYIYIYI
jgi:hypothetical protein